MSESAFNTTNQQQQVQSRVQLARAISKLETGSAADLSAAMSLDLNDTWVLGITGATGVGKSTLVARLLDMACAEGGRVAVVAVDPSSPDGGALLGDRVRMLWALDNHSDVFMRSLATRSHVGGLSRVSPAVIRMLATHGYKTIIVETVGVGQSEIEVIDVADTVLVVAGPDGGDWLQAAKSGLMEIGHVFGVAKADREGANAMVREIETALHLRATSMWSPPVMAFSSLENTGIELLWNSLTSHREHLAKSGVRRPVPIRHLAHAAIDAALDVLTQTNLAGLPTDPAKLLDFLAQVLRDER